MTTLIYRHHKIEFTERANFFDADVFYPDGSKSLYAFVFLNKNHTAEDIVAHAKRIVDEKIASEERSGRRTPNIKTRELESIRAS
jgi:hypothetical protein